MKGIKVTVEDLEKGTKESKEIWNDFIIITAGNRYVDSINTWANGTTQLTIKKIEGKEN